LTRHAIIGNKPKWMRGKGLNLNGFRGMVGDSLTITHHFGSDQPGVVMKFAAGGKVFLIGFFLL